MDTIDTKAIIAVAQESVKPILDHDNKLLVFPSVGNHESRVVDLDKTYFLGRELQPRRKTGTIKVFNVQSLNSFIAHNRDAGNITVYCDSNPLAPSIVAVLNDHGDEGPGHRDLRCVVEFRQTPEWKKWLGINGKMIAQEEFAEFIEENMVDIVDPTGAQMLEIVTYLQATRSADFKSALSLSSGAVQFTNVENLNASVGAGQIAVPTEFTLGIVPIQGSPRFKINARFRFRITDGKLRLGLKLLRIEEVMGEVFDMAVADIARDEATPDEHGEITGKRISILEGTP